MTPLAEHARDPRKLNAEELALVAERKTVPAIRLYKARTGAGLKDAITAVNEANAGFLRGVLKLAGGKS